MSHYHTLFLMQQEHQWSWADLQHMIPFERDIQLSFMKTWAQEKMRANNERKAMAQARG